MYYWWSYLYNIFSDKTINGVTYSATEVNDMAEQIKKWYSVVARLADKNKYSKAFCNSCRIRYF